MDPLPATSDQINPSPVDWTRALVSAIDDAIFVHDLEGNFLEVNDAACRWLGYTRDELLRMNTSQIDAPEFARGFNQRMQCQVREGHFRCEGVHVAKDGHRILVDINTLPAQLEGKPAILAVVRDVTRRREVEDAIARQSELWQSILDNMGEAVLVVQADGIVLLSNPAAKRLFPQGPLTVFCAHENQPALTVQPLTRCLGGESFEHQELYVPASPLHGGRWVSLTGRPLRVRTGEVRGGMLVARDISTRRRRERHQQMQYALARALAESETLHEIAQKVLKLTAEGLNREVGVLWSVNAAEDCLECVDTWNREGLALDEFLRLTMKSVLSLGLGVPGQVWLQGQPAWETLEVCDSQFDRTGLAAQAGLRSVWAFPIVRGTQTVGVIEFFGVDHRAPDEEMRALLMALGSQLGQVLARQRMEKALRDSEALYESLVESLPQNILRKDRDGRFTYANRRFCQTVNRLASEVLGKTDFDLFPLDMATKYVTDDRRLIETGEPLETIEEHRTSEGKRLFVQVVKTVVLDAAGEIVGVQGMFWDVTEKKLAQEMVAQSERQYRLLTEATLDAIIVTDEENKILLFNPAAEKMYGYRAEEMIGKSAMLLAPVAARSAHEAGLRRYRETREPYLIGGTAELRGLRKDGVEFPIEVAVSVLSLDPESPESGPVHFLAAIRDLTERNKMRSVLVQNEKLASIGLLSAGVAHEINNPLAFVSNNLAVLERDCRGLLAMVSEIDERRRANGESAEAWQGWQAKAEVIDLAYLQENLPRLLDRTRDGVSRVTRIVQSLRGLARTEAPRRQDANLADLVDGSIEIIRGKYRQSGIEVVQEHAEPPRVRCVSTQIDQVILNVLVNAFQAIANHRKEGGKIWVRSRQAKEDVILEIEDNGPGMSPSVLPKIFDPFFTTKDVGEGTGLGLSISHHIISAHGGRLEAENVPGGGARFRIVLPTK